MKITIFWTGYVWLVTWTCLAEIGHEVICVDIDEKKISNLKQWIIPIYEPWLDELVKRNYNEKRLDFTTDAKMAIDFSNVIFSAVWTPPDKENAHKADLKFVKQIATTLWQNMNSYKVLINKSTVPVWTGKICQNIIKNELQIRWKNIEFDIISNPEFLREWSAVWDFLNPDRIVCWIWNESSKKIMEEIYAPLSDKTQIIFTDVKSSEIIKYAANAFLATKISFINEIANFCELSWWNIQDVSKWIWTDKRIWKEFLEAWIWYGWSCFPKDIQALIETWKDFNYNFQIIKSTHEVNKKQKIVLVEKLKKHTELKDKNIWILWLAFKAKTDDIRDAASLEIIEELIDNWVGLIKVYDPVAMDNVKNYLNDKKIIEYKDNSYDVCEWIDALLIVTNWDEFKTLDLKKIKKVMNWNIIIDWRNIYKLSEMKNLWFIYESIWR